MSDLPELKNEPSIDMPRGDLGAFAHGSDEYRRDHPDEVNRKSPFKYLSALLTILVALVGGWHWFAASQLESQLSRHLADSALENLPEISATVNVLALTNLVEIEITRTVTGKDPRR